MKYLKYLFLSIVLMNYSCEDFLNVKPAGEIVNDELFNSDQGFEEALYGVYSTLGSKALYGEMLSYHLSDAAAQYFYSQYDFTKYVSNYDYKHSDSRIIVDSVWSGMYQNISYVNNILENLDKKDSKSMKLYNLYKGEALGLRAFMHFELLRYFAESYTNNKNARGIPYRESYTFNVFPFESVEASYNKVIRDLDEAERLISEHGEYFGSHNVNESSFTYDRFIHLNLYAIQAVKARVYWSMGNLEKASENALKVINSGKFSLEPTTGIENLMNGTLNPNETIFGVYSRNGFSEITRKHLYYSSGLTVKEDYQSIYELDKDGFDYRYDTWFKTLGDFGAEGLKCVKILDWFDIKQIERPSSRIKGINIIRLPEMHYIVSEYYLSIDDFVNANKHFDKVLISRGLTPYASREGIKLTIEKINIDRRKEFVAEGLYFHVMKKYNMQGYNLTTDQTYEASAGIYILPVPILEEDFINNK